MDEIVVLSSVNITQSHVLKFPNPFLETISLSIELIQESNQFNLMLSKRKTFNVGAGDAIDIPFTFSPKELQLSTAKISIYMNEEMKWIYPVRGIVETILPIKTVLVESRARDKMVKNIEIELIGQRFEDETMDTLKERLEISFESFKNVELEKFLAVNISEYKALAASKVLIQLNITLCSKKPIDAVGSICITDQKAFCRWKIPVHLAVTLPSLKETIILQNNQRTNSFFESSFMIKTRSPQEQKFTAYFLKGDQFLVSPSSGILKPDSLMKNSDNLFNVCLKSPQNSKYSSSVLVIEVFF